jgi:hypothetical protein
MSVQDQFIEMNSAVRDFPGFEILFDEAVMIKSAPHVHLFTCYGVNVAADGKTMVLDNQGQWHELHPNQANAHYIISSLLQRIKLLQHDRQKVSTGQ